MSCLQKFMCACLLFTERQKVKKKKEHNSCKNTQNYLPSCIGPSLRVNINYVLNFNKLSSVITEIHPS